MIIELARGLAYDTLTAFSLARLLTALFLWELRLIDIKSMF